jgi:hypothetical protein
MDNTSVMLNLLALPLMGMGNPAIRAVRFNELVQQPGWLFHQSRRCGGFLAEIRHICCFFSGSCSRPEVIEQP